MINKFMVYDTSTEKVNFFNTKEAAERGYNETIKNIQEQDLNNKRVFLLEVSNMATINQV